ncbi:hypothetical protein TNCV_217761 [Trichonephila clavipes]|nr:hypothetical protein TNCV_217761 [Trichonephila clavipes]
MDAGDDGGYPGSFTKHHTLKSSSYHGIIPPRSIQTDSSTQCQETNLIKKAVKGRKRCTISVDDRRTKIIRFSDKRIPWTSIRSDLRDADVSVSSKIIRSRLEDQDSALCHTVKKWKDWYRSKIIELLSWPGKSPDLDPIKNLLHRLKTLARMRYL